MNRGTDSRDKNVVGIYRWSSKGKNIMSAAKELNREQIMQTYRLNGSENL